MYDFQLFQLPLLLLVWLLFWHSTCSDISIVRSLYFRIFSTYYYYYYHYHHHHHHYYFYSASRPTLGPTQPPTQSTAEEQRSAPKPDNYLFIPLPNVEGTSADRQTPAPPHFMAW